jgi:hypothetical protein
MAGCFAATLVSSLFPVSGAFVDRLCLSFIKAFIHPKKKTASLDSKQYFQLVYPCIPYITGMT